MNGLLALAQTKDEYLLIWAIITADGVLSAATGIDCATKVYIEQRLEEFRQLPRSVDSYLECPSSTGPIRP